MKIIIGGSGSTGSSLLKNILSRHPNLFSGSETSLFSKKELFQDFNRHKYRILKRFPKGLKSHSYHMYNGIDLLNEEYGHNILSINSLINDSNDFQSFANGFFKIGCNRNNKKYWMEKTPSNAFLFKEFLDSFNDSKAIHITRNPYDTIASLLNRGFDLVYACGIYLLNNLAALRSYQHSNYLLIKYEDLINEPESSIKELCRGLKLKFYDVMLEPGNQYNIQDTKIQSWSFDEMERVKKKRNSSFDKLGDDEKKRIISAINIIEISNNGKEYFNIKLSSFKELCEIFNYELISENNENVNLKYLHRLLLKDRIHRIIKNYPTGLCYPLRIN